LRVEAVKRRKIIGISGISGISGGCFVELPKA
jgi:hypothetical protein